MKHLAIGTALLLSAIGGMTSPALASDSAATTAASIGEAASTLAPNAYVWNDPADGGPVTIVVSLASQRAYVYRGTGLVAATTVSTGKDGKETPVGVFPILQKNENHKSNLYNSAPMPFMQRLTWDGVALHAGRNPGFPASHGCIRMPAAFAKKLFDVTSVGTTVVVTDATIDEAAELDTTLLETESSRANGQQLAMIGR